MEDSTKKSNLLRGGYGSLVGKIFLASIREVVQGRRPSVDFKLEEKSYSVLREAIDASKEFNEAVNSTNADLALIEEKLQLKYAASQKFSRCFGTPWPL